MASTQWGDFGNCILESNNQRQKLRHWQILTLTVSGSALTSRPKLDRPFPTFVSLFSFTTPPSSHFFRRCLTNKFLSCCKCKVTWNMWLSIWTVPKHLSGETWCEWKIITSFPLSEISFCLFVCFFLSFFLLLGHENYGSPHRKLSKTFYGPQQVFMNNSW